MKRIKELDSIRGLAALVIVFYHLWFQNIGILGTAVDLFFVLSGLPDHDDHPRQRIQRAFLVQFLHSTRLANLANLLPDSACHGLDLSLLAAPAGT